MAVALALHGFLQQRGGDPASAEAELREALTIFRRHPGDVPQLAYALYRVADVLTVQGKFADAEPLALECLATQASIYGPEDPPIQATRRMLARIYTGLGDQASAARWQAPATPPSPTPPPAP